MHEIKTVPSFPQDETWIAIDDDPEAYPPGAPVLMTDPERRFNEEASRELSARLVS